MERITNLRVMFVKKVYELNLSIDSVQHPHPSRIQVLADELNLSTDSVQENKHTNLLQRQV